MPLDSECWALAFVNDQSPLVIESSAARASVPEALSPKAASMHLRLTWTLLHYLQMHMAATYSDGLPFSYARAHTRTSAVTATA